MNDEEIRRDLAGVARDALGYDGPLEGEMRLVEDLELDSIRLLTLATEVEDHFRICLDENDEAAIVRVSDLVGVIGRKLAEKGRPGTFPRGRRYEGRRDDATDRRTPPRTVP